MYGFGAAEAFGGGGETRVEPPKGLNEGDCVAGDMLPGDIELPAVGPAVCLHPTNQMEATAKTSVAKDSLRMTCIPERQNRKGCRVNRLGSLTNFAELPKGHSFFESSNCLQMPFEWNVLYLTIFFSVANEATGPMFLTEWGAFTGSPLMSLTTSRAREGAR